MVIWNMNAALSRWKAEGSLREVKKPPENAHLRPVSAADFVLHRKNPMPEI